MSKLFGSKSRPVTQPTTFETLPGFGRQAFQQAVEAGQEIPTSAFAPAGLTGQQQAALSTLEGGLQPFTPEQFQTQLSTFQDPFEEQVVQSALADLQRTGRGVLSDIGAGASAAGGFGGTRQALLEAELGRSLGQEAGALSGRLRSQGFQAATQRALENLARPLDVAGNLFQLGETQRGIQTQQQLAPVAQAQFLSNLARGLPTGGGQTTFQGGQTGILGDVGRFAGGLGGLAEGLGGAAGLAKIGSGLLAFSDHRLKENIKPVGRSKGHNIYEFNYKGQPERYRGVMAHEVFLENPEAVQEIGGYLTVDYNAIGLEMEQI